MRTTEKTKEIQRLLGGWTGRSDERRILELLRSCEGAELDAVLRKLNLRRLVRNLHDRVGGPDHRTQLLQLLTIDRIADITLEVRVKLVWALQRGFTRHGFEIAIRNVMLASTGMELRELRNELNLSDSSRDLPHLLFKAIDDVAIRTEILDHIRANQVPTDFVKVLSDIDDTVFARLHDNRYPGKTRYPGVLAFFAALNHAAGKEGAESNITFVTARPGLIGGLVAWWTRRTLRKAGILKPTILTGSLLALLSKSRMAERKIHNIRQYHQVFPEYGLVFVGDSGQGDMVVGELMREEFPEAVRAILIHDINETALAQPDVSDARGIELFDSYVAAAALAWKHGLITHQQAVEVGNAAVKELRGMTLMSPTMRRQRLQEHIHDLQTLASAT